MDGACYRQRISLRNAGKQEEELEYQNPLLASILMSPVRVEVNDKMQKGYVYFRTKPMGRAFQPGFTPELTPRQMLELGVFGGKYMTDCRKEFPASWFKRAKLSRDRSRPSTSATSESRPALRGP